ncbi:MAG: DUF4270 domain-containing protein [Porphyromonas sp.]|nr:DUF4270 domain-containing protein [Porphyromonas sp.]
MTNSKDIIRLLLLLGAIATAISACDSNTKDVGGSLLPDYTKVTATSASYSMALSTISADLKNNTTKPVRPGTSYNNIYVNSTLGYIGSIPNQEFGDIKCEYLTQVYAPRNFKFKTEPTNHQVDSAFITLYYSGFSGDSIAPIEVSAYQLVKPLPFDKYSISDISEYVDMGNLLGKSSFHANKGHGALGNGQKYIQIPIAQALAQDFYDKSEASDPIFATQAAFDNYFPGIYLRNSAGSGSVLGITDTAITFYFTVEEMVKRPSTGKIDSLAKVVKIEELTHTSEVPQLSRFANDDVDKLLAKAENGSYSYIKSPAGVLTEVVIPTKKIRADLVAEAPEGFVRELNSVHVSIKGEKQDRGTYALNPPSDLLLLPRDSVANFFEKEKTELNAPYSSFISTRVTAGSLIYDFGNITSVILEHMEDHPDEDMTLWLIPVERTVDNNQQSPNYGSSTSISNLILPSALKISTQPKDLEIQAIFTERKIGAPF